MGEGMSPAKFAELELRTKSQNFRREQGAQAIRTLIQKVPEHAQNRETIIAVYQTFAAALSGKLEAAPEVPLRRKRAPAAKKSSR